MSKDADTTTETIPFDAAQRKLGVVVGFDGSENSVLALTYAARIAQRRGSLLTVVNSVAIPAGVYTTLSAVPRVPSDELEKRAIKEILDQAAAELKDYPGEVSYVGETGDAAGVLVEKSRQAELVVVGSRGHGGFLGLLLGSVASALPAHAHAPTIIVPRNYKDGVLEGAARFAPSESTAPVVVGTDGSQHSRVAVLLGAQEAVDRGVELQLLTVLPEVDGALLWYPEHQGLLADSTDKRRNELKESLDQEAQWATEHYPGLTVSTEVETGDPITLLRKKTGSAQLTLAGTRGRGGLRSLLLGSVSRGLLLRADGPVMVVPELQDDRL